MTTTATFTRRSALMAASGGLALTAAAPLRAGPLDKTLMVPVDQATNVALSASPDGRRIAFDLYGTLWIIDARGGAATALTDAYGDVAQPQWSPDGKRIAIQCYRDGNYHICTVPAAGGPIHQLTVGTADHREPCWSPEGGRLAMSSDREDGRYAIYILETRSGVLTRFSRGGGQHSQPTWSPDGKTIAYVVDDTRIVVQKLDEERTVEVARVTRDPLNDPPRLFAPSFIKDMGLLHVRQDKDGVTMMHGPEVLIQGRDLYPFRAAPLPDGSILFGSDGGIWRRARSGKCSPVPFEATVPVTRPAYRRKARDFWSMRPQPVRGIVAPALSPDGSRIAFGALNDLWLSSVDGTARRLVSDGYSKCDPAWSPNGQTIAYASDKGGTLDLWLHDLESGASRQLTSARDHALTSPAWAPDGRSLACLDHRGAVLVVDAATGAARQVHGPQSVPGRPSFSPNGNIIALAAFRAASPRFREGWSEILTIDLATSATRMQGVAPGKSLAGRGLDGPVWSPDGRHMTYVFASTLWLAPVSRTGMLAGPPRQLNDEPTDAPTWSGDSRSILYLSNGRLRLIDIGGGAIRTVPLDLRWANAVPPSRLLIRPELVWDGASEVASPASDVLVEGNRIVDVLPRGRVSDVDVKVIDAPGQTLIPGLIDAHVHRQMPGYGLGDRMGRTLLAFGITAMRSPGSPAYHMVEDREAILSGARVAPRPFATGEPLDGSRIYYAVMRPVTEPGQLALELARAEALDYDLIKTYVRLPDSSQRDVTARAHAIGIPVASHYLYPALRHGGDCMEHMGATNRLGYSRTRTLLGAGYRDVTRLFAAAHADRTSTLFVATALLRDNDLIARDERVAALFPPWAQEELRHEVDRMHSANQNPDLESTERQVRQMLDMMSLGWHIVAGTDAPLDTVGISLHLNLRAMVRFGMRPTDALRTATVNAGKLCGAPVGQIARNMLADMVLVDGNPLLSIDDAARTRSVIANGVVHTPSSLAAPFRA